MSSVDSNKISEILRECAQRYVLPRYKNLKDHEISTKSGPTDLVTQADKDVEAHLDRVLPGLIPGSVVVGEEAVAEGRTGLAAAMKSDGPIWVIDPVDGTHNFVQGGNQFGILLALVDKGQARAGWIYDIPKNEMTTVEQGAGAFTEGRRLKIAAAPPVLSEMSGYLPRKAVLPEVQVELDAARKVLKNTSPLFSAVHIYLSVVTGERQFVIMSKPKPWDHLAGVLMVGEAGGYSAKWDGSPYTTRDGDQMGLMAAGSREIWDFIYDGFLRKIAAGG